MLRDVLGGNSKCLVIVTGVMSPLQLKPTQGALDFGDNCKGVTRVVTAGGLMSELVPVLSSCAVIAEKKKLSFTEMQAKMQWYEGEIRKMHHEVELRNIDIESLKKGVMPASMQGTPRGTHSARAECSGCAARAECSGCGKS